MKDVITRLAMPKPDTSTWIKQISYHLCNVREIFTENMHSCPLDYIEEMQVMV